MDAHEGFPRLYAAASLKHVTAPPRLRAPHPISAALCRGLIEAMSAQVSGASGSSISAALCRGLIEAPGMACSPGTGRRFPRLYAAASLKHGPVTCG